MNVKFVLAFVLSCLAFPVLSQTDSEDWKPKRATLLHISYSSGALEAIYTLRSGDVLQLIQDEIIIAEVTNCTPQKEVTLNAPADTTLSRNRDEDSIILTPPTNSKFWLFNGNQKDPFSFTKRSPITAQFISFGVKCSAKEIW